MYRQHFTVMAGLILISFTLLATTFIALTYEYIMNEKEETLQRNASYIAQFTADSLAQDISMNDRYFQAYISSLSTISGANVILCNSNGTLLYTTNANDQPTPSSFVLPSWVVNHIITHGSYTGMSSLNGFLPGNHLVAGAAITTKVPVLTSGSLSSTTLLRGLVFVTEDTSSATALWRGFATIFVLTAVVVLIAAFVTSSVTTMRTIRPLRDLADAVRRFGHGEFAVRVTGYDDRMDEMGELTRAFNSMADSLAVSEAKRSEFVANISHELKTPMTTISGFADGMLDGTIPPSRERDSLQIISSETRRLSRLVRQMLDLSLIQSDQNIALQEQFDVREVLLRVLVSLESKITARDLDVDTNLPEDALQVWGNPDAITQVCYNLLDNAIKFSDEGGVLGIGITTKGKKALVTVRNQGETIAPEQLPLIFDRFHKTDPSRSIDRDGVGLGLYIVKTLLNGHKEDIIVTSEDGTTEFTFTLTLA